MGLVVNPFRVLPVVGEVLVQEDGDDPAAPVEDPDDFREQPALRIEDLARVGSRVIPVLGDKEDAIDRQLARPTGQGAGDVLGNRDVMLASQAPADVAGGDLVGVERDESSGGFRPLPSSVSVSSRRLRITSAWALW